MFLLGLFLWVALVTDEQFGEPQANGTEQVHRHGLQIDEERRSQKESLQLQKESLRLHKESLRLQKESLEGSLTGFVEDGLFEKTTGNYGHIHPLAIQVQSPLGEVEGEPVLEVNEIIGRLNDYYGEKESLKISFLEVQEQSFRRGEILMKDTSKFRINYIRQGDQYIQIYSLGEEMYVYLKNFSVVYQQKLKESSPEKNFGFLNMSYFVSNYDFSFDEVFTAVPLFDIDEKKRFLREGEEVPLVYRLRLSPKDLEMGLDSMKMYVGQQGRVWRITSKDIEGEQIDYYFAKEDFELIPDREFNFIIPADVRVIKDLIEVEN